MFCSMSSVTVDVGAASGDQNVQLSPMVRSILSGAPDPAADARVSIEEEPTHLPGQSFAAPSVTSTGRPSASTAPSSSLLGAMSGGSNPARPSFHLPSVPADITAMVDSIESAPANNGRQTTPTHPSPAHGVPLFGTDGTLSKYVVQGPRQRLG
jgi:hypothetical protein